MIWLPPSARPRDPAEEYQSKRGTLYLDESGQMNANHANPSLVEMKVMGGVLIPDRPNDHDGVHVLVRRLREKIHGSPDSKQPVKARDLSDDDRAFVRMNMSVDWMIGTQYFAVNDSRIDTLRPILTEFGDGCLSELKPHLLPYGIDLGPLEEQYHTEVASNPIYMFLLKEIYQRTAEWAKGLKIRPQLTVYLDEKISPKKQALVDFMGRMFLCREFPGAFSGSRILGLYGGPSSEFACKVSTDSLVDGLVLADIFANAAGMVAREQDPTRTYENLLPANDVAVRAVRAKRAAAGLK